MDNTVNQDVTNDTATPETTGNERTFTQAELDAIVSDRLKRDRAKYADYDDLKAKASKLDELEEANKSELQKATERAQALENEVNTLKHAEELRTMREKVSNETGVPIRLLSAETEDECKEQAKDIMEFAKPSAYPSVKDGGEVKYTGKPSTRDLFADWADKAL